MKTKNGTTGKTNPWKPLGNNADIKKTPTLLMISLLSLLLILGSASYVLAQEGCDIHADETSCEEAAECTWCPECDNPHCVDIGTCSYTTGNETEEIGWCLDEIDNDCDGDTDFDDTDCAIDLGDAPDSTNTVGSTMTAYTGTQANYPTVHVAGSPPHGPCHMNFFARLGTEISYEQEADTGPDQDGVNNIIPPTDTPDQDSISLPFGMDDGLKHVPIDPTTSTLSLPHCQQTSIPVEVTISGGPYTADWDAYLNIWIDYNRDGDWGTITTADTVTCSSPGDTSEWVVQNYVVASLSAGGYGSGTIVVNPAFMGYNPNPGDTVWMRVQLTEVKVTYEDGSGPAYCYEDGETEDYYVTLGTTGISTTTTLSTTTTTTLPSDTTTTIPTDTTTTLPSDTTTTIPIDTTTTMAISTTTTTTTTLLTATTAVSRTTITTTPATTTSVSTTLPVTTTTLPLEGEGVSWIVILLILAILILGILIFLAMKRRKRGERS